MARTSSTPENDLGLEHCEMEKREQTILRISESMHDLPKEINMDLTMQQAGFSTIKLYRETNPTFILVVTCQTINETM